MLSTLMAFGIQTLVCANSTAVPLFFVKNVGQTDSSIRYYVDAPELRAGFANDSVVFQKHGQQIRMRFADANPNVRLKGLVPMSGRANFFVGDQPARSLTDVPMYQQIVYQDLYPGIDLTYSGSGATVKSEFVVFPGSDVGTIRLQYPDDCRISVGSDGDLVVRVGSTLLREKSLIVYQTIAGNRVPVIGRYQLLGLHTVGFQVGSYDVTQALTIDPVVTYATYLGGSSVSSVTALAVDAAGDLYATGWTESLNFPTSGAIQAVNNGSVNAFVVKFNAQGSNVLYATYLGGSNDDRSAGIAVDTSGNAYITGATGSQNFPTVAPAFPTLGGPRNAFVSKLNASGNALLYSTFLGGGGWDAGVAIAVDGAGQAHVTGTTQSTNFPLVNPVQLTLGGTADAFVTTLTATGTVLFSTFLGGTGVEIAGSIAVDSGGNTYVTGGTYSTDFPTVGPIQAVNRGREDAFITKFSSGRIILYSTYLGGSGATPGTIEQGTGIAVDSSGSAYVTGVTNSADFPTAGNVFQGALLGSENAFIAKLNPTGTALTYCTYLGGSSQDLATAIAVNSLGNAWVAGYSASRDFPQVFSLQPTFGGLVDAFIAEINSAGSALSFSSFYGGSQEDIATSLALNAAGEVFVGGQTSSIDFPLTSPYQSFNKAGATGWILNVNSTVQIPSRPSISSLSPTAGSGNSATLTIVYGDTGGAGALTTVGLLVGPSALSAAVCYVRYSAVSGQLALQTTSGVFVPITATTSATNSQCTLVGSLSSAIVSSSGNTLTLSIGLVFQSGFIGSQTIYLSATDAVSTTGWISSGSWNVTVTGGSGGSPVANSVVPSSGTGAGERFTFVISDRSGSSYLTYGAILFASTFNTLNACYLEWDGIANTISITYDNPTQGQTPFTPGTPGIATNSQCTLNAANSSISTSATQVVITLDLTFNSSFFGPKNIYLYAAEGSINSGWATVGTWTVTGGTPSATSALPSSGVGSLQSFFFTISDSSSQTNLTGVSILFTTGAPVNIANACNLFYNRTAQTIGLWDNSGNTMLSTKSEGSSTLLQNSQCGVQYTQLVVSTNQSVTLQIQILFNTTNFAGPRSIYLGANEPNTNSGFVDLGTWTVSSIGPSATTTTAAAASVTHNASSQNVTLSATVVSPGGTVSAGAVTFTILSGTTQVGSSVTSGTVTGGLASATYSVPGGTAAGSYTIQAVYGGGALFAGSIDAIHMLTIH
jgi:Beta-propeller repeat